MEFQIKESFYIDGKETKLISGAVHYFRIMPDKWAHTLYNLKAMGCNTVETYIPWNLHEPKQGVYNFSGLADVETFIELAQTMDLYVILRPSPYICAEWEFGGLPAWLLKDGNMRIRSQYHGFITAVAAYYQELISRLSKFQYTEGGKVLMMQIENEYGSFSNDKGYLKIIAQLLKDNGVTVPLFTSDGGWEQVLDAGTLSEAGILATVNFGSDAEGNFKALKKHFNENNICAPYMCMEFWDGWFNNWQEPIIKRDGQETASVVKDILKWGSINFYMFQGGTNFGFYNGCSDFGEKNLAQITSYDYDAPLTEWGAPTDKFFAIQKAIKESCPEVEICEPKYPVIGALGHSALVDKVSLFAVIDQVSTKVFNDYPLTMELVDQEFGYILYRSSLARKRVINDLRVVDAGDRIQFYINEEWKQSQYLDKVGDSFEVELTKEKNQLDILVENTGRNNYGPKLVAPIQRKGIRGGVMEDIHYISGWEHYSLDFSKVSEIDFSKPWKKNQPSFYRFTIEVTEPIDTFLDCTDMGKGIVLINGFNIGKYWEKGPVTNLFVPSSLWKSGENEIVVFNSEGTEIEQLHFIDHPTYLT